MKSRDKVYSTVKMLENIANTNCTGCGACANNCPIKCISMLNDDEGFLIPHIDIERCLKCDYCSSIACPVINPVSLNHPLYVYAGFSKEKELLKKSSSGAVYPILAAHILKNDGIVFATVCQAGGLPHHVKIETFAELEMSLRSKYVQGNVEAIYIEIKQLLKTTNRKILFVGTPCQVAGLKKSLIDLEQTNNLYTIDLFCHGAPSPQLYLTHLKYLQKRINKKIDKIEFRLKPDESSNSYYYTYLQEEKRVKVGKFNKDVYFNAFINSESYREICYECRYAQKNRIGDISLGDYRSGWLHHPDFQNYFEKTPNLNLSAILINTDKGRRLFEEVESRIIYEETEINWINERNYALKEPAARPTSRDHIFREINNIGYERWAKRKHRNLHYIIECMKDALRSSKIWYWAKKVIKR